MLIHGWEIQKECDDTISLRDMNLPDGNKWFFIKRHYHPEQKMGSFIYEFLNAMLDAEEQHTPRPDDYHC